MKHIELYIRVKDWIIILFMGLFISCVLSSLIYFLMDLNVLHGLIFGLILGMSISMLAMFFISLLNNYILPIVEKNYWLVLAIIFSFFSGFFGTNITMLLSLFLDIDVIEKLEINLISFSFLIGILTYFVGAMMYAMVKMANLKEHNEQKLLQSRLKSLETQLNPHFLFNSLNSLAELIHSDTQKSENLIIKLSQFLRNTMEEKPLLSLAKEIQNVKEYIDIENIRFEDKIALNIEYDKELETICIPKFSIQLLVENAIKHGFILSEGIDINIKVFKTDTLEIIVSNNGKEIIQKKFGIGLKNLQERLKILCAGKLEILDLKYPTYKISIGKYDENISSG